MLEELIQRMIGVTTATRLVSENIYSVPPKGLLTLLESAQVSL